MDNRLEHKFRELLNDVLEFDLSDKHMQDTPKRVAHFWQETMEYGWHKSHILRSLGLAHDQYLKQLADSIHNPGTTPESVNNILDLIRDRAKVTTFDEEPYSEPQKNQITRLESGFVTVYPIKVYGWCAHHLAPMFGHVLIAYKPIRKLLGLSKLPRVAKFVAKQPMVQEQYTFELAAIIRLLTDAPVIVVTRLRHLCMEMRGVQETEATTVYHYAIGLTDNDKLLLTEYVEMLTENR